MSETPAPNRLIATSSPYLLQHAHNPVAWYPWGDEALSLARALDRPIHLSVGYAACHWCHVMAHESFEDPATAAVMNAGFVNIKVDREERPDIDAIYMQAVQAMTGRGGWPMTVFLTPDGVPFYGGTYYPKEDRYGMPAFTRVLAAVSDAWANRRADLLAAGDELAGRLRAASEAQLPPGALRPATLDAAFAALADRYDAVDGGFGDAPKFPQPMVLEFLLRYSRRTASRPGMEMLEHTLRTMAEGGMYDQLGGGFHRYSVDGQWLVPHFEKMLYDNALLARTYTETFQVTGDAFYRDIAERTLAYIERELLHPSGMFFSTQDADSLEDPHGTHKEEGAFFVWTPAQIRAIIGDDALLFSQAYDVTERGNFEGKNILHVVRRPAELASLTGLPAEQIEQTLHDCRQKLFAARAQRPRPTLDDKVLSAWNGMAIRAFALAASAFDAPRYAAIAERAADALLATLRDADGRLLRSWRDASAGTQQAAPVAPIRGFLEDYALLADGLLALYSATFAPHWLDAARALADAMLDSFWDDAIGGFYDTASDHERLVVRPRSTDDNATPAGASVAADVLLRLATIFDEPRYRERAMTVLESMASLMECYPTGFGRYLAAAEFALAPVRSIVVVGERADPATQALLAEALRPFLSSTVVLAQQPSDPPLATPLLDGRIDAAAPPTAYVCEGLVCQLPARTPEELRRQLDLSPS